MLFVLIVLINDLGVDYGLCIVFCYEWCKIKYVSDVVMGK